MGTVIEAVGTARSGGGREGSLKLAIRAARESLAAAGWRGGDLDVIVNTGAYRDGNIAEPSMAPLIQRGIDANSGVPLSAAEPSTFSFDLSGGGCGFLQGLQVVDGMIRSGRARRGLVVTSDIAPDTPPAEGCFEPAGGAMLLRSGEAEEGFVGFHFETFPKHANLFNAALHFNGNRDAVKENRRHAVVAKQEPDYLEKCVDCADLAIRRFLGTLDLAACDVDLVLPSQFPSGFGGALAERLQLDPGAIVDLGETGSVHTAGLALAFEAGSRRDIGGAGCSLFVAVGAGIQVGLGLYAGTAPIRIWPRP